MSQFAQFLKFMSLARAARIGQPDGGGNSIQFPNGQLNSAVLARPSGASGAQRIWSPAPYPAGTTNVTLQNQIPVPAGVNGFSLIYENGTSTASTLNACKVAFTNTDGDSGSALTWTAGTFAGASSIALPVAVGTAPQSVITPIVSDRFDIPASGAYLMVRSYFSGSGCALNPAAGELTAFAGATGLIYKTGFGAGAVADNVGIAMSAGQLICPSGVIWYADRPTLTLAAFGGSTFRGQGSTANALGMITRAAVLLSNSARLCVPYVAAQSGQNSITATSQVAKTLATLRPDVVLILGGSGNDGDLSATGFAAMRSRVAANVEQARKIGAIPIVCTLMPSVSLTEPQNVLRQAQNDWIMNTLTCALKADIATAAANPANPNQILPAYNSGDGTHLNDAGYAATAAVIAATCSNCIILQ
jgi:lysophospholipase L1-like esterase